MSTNNVEDGDAPSLLLIILALILLALSSPPAASSTLDLSPQLTSSVEMIDVISPFELAVKLEGDASPEKPSAEEIHTLRVKKLTRLVQTFYNYDGRASIEPHIEHFISEHERFEREGGEKARGFGATWWWSAVYGASNFGLTCYRSAPGSCYGPMDVKHYPLVTDPCKNITWHIKEQFGFYKRGVWGIELAKSVMYPARPHDWGASRFCSKCGDQTRRNICNLCGAKTRVGKNFDRMNTRHSHCIARGYAVGKLP